MQQRIPRILIFVSLSLLLLALVTLISIPPAHDFETSIYDSLPLSFWISLLASVLAAQIALFAMASASNWTRHLWMAGMTAVILDIVLLYIVPLVRGYYVFGRGDALSHIGWTEDILNSGRVSSSDIYPVSHIMASVLASASEDGVIGWSFASPALFSFFYLLSFFLVARQLLADKKKVAIALIVASIPMFSYYHVLFAPYPQAFFLFPFAFYLTTKARCWRGPAATFPLIAVIVMLVFLHPLSALLFVFSLLLWDIWAWFGKTRWKSVGSRNSLLTGHSRIALFTISIFLIWQAYAYALVLNFRTVLSGITGGPAESEFQINFSALGGAGFSSYELIQYVLNVYGQWIALCILSIFALFVVWKRRNRDARYKLSADGLISMQFLSFLALSSVVLLTAYIFGFIRILILAVFFSCLLVPHLFVGRTQRPRAEHILGRTALFTLMLAVLIVLSVSNIYPSKRILIDNQQVTRAEEQGMILFFGARDPQTPILEWGLSQVRFHDFIYGTGHLSGNLTYGSKAAPLKHLGYVANGSFGNSYKSSVYLLLTSSGLSYFQYQYPANVERWDYTPKDFASLYSDTEVNLILSNGNLDVWLTAPR